VQIFSLFIVFSAWSSCNFQETNSTRERDSCRKHTIFFGSTRAGTTRNREREGYILYFQVPREAQQGTVSARVHIVFSGTSQSTTRNRERKGTYCIFKYLEGTLRRASCESVKRAFWVPCEEQLAKQGYFIFGYLATRSCKHRLR
jgi:hypothetical protein